MVECWHLTSPHILLPVECFSDVVGVCFTFSGRMFVAGDFATVQEAEDIVLPEVQRYLQSGADWGSIDPRILDIVYLVSDDGQLGTPEPLPGAPTLAPTPTAPTSCKSSRLLTACISSRFGVAFLILVVALFFSKILSS